MENQEQQTQHSGGASEASRPPIDPMKALAALGIADTAGLTYDDISARVHGEIRKRLENDAGFRQPFEQKARALIARELKAAMNLDESEGKLETMEQVFSAIKNKYHGADEQGKQALKEMQRLEAERDSLRARLEQEQHQWRERDTVRTVMSETKAAMAIAGISADIDFMLPAIYNAITSSHRIIVGENGRIEITDADGNVKLNPKTSQPLTIRDLVENIAEQKKLKPVAGNESFSHPAKIASSSQKPAAQKTANEINLEYWNSLNKSRK